MPGAWRETGRIRRIGSANLAAAALAGGAERFIQESFAPIYEDGGDAWLDERSPVRPARYNRTALDAEASAERFTGGGGAGIALRFAYLYGPDSDFTRDTIRYAKKGWAATFGGPAGFISSVSHDDAASAVVAAVSAPAGVYNVVDDEPLRRREYFDALGEVLGVAPPRLPPVWVKSLAGSIGETVARSQRISNRKLRDAAGWAPRYRSVREGWRAALAALALAAPLSAQSPCDAPDSLGPSRDLYCMELIAAPGISGVSGRVELSQPPGPFTVSVTADGRPRYRPIVSLAGLPSPSSYGRYGTYVAWVAGPTMTPVTGLGAVGNGRTPLPVIELEKFVILITAERTVAAKEPSSRVILRAQSPGTRLMPPDFLTLTLGSARTPASHGHDMAGSGAPGWAMVPMPPGLTMLPGEMSLHPGVSPYLPSGDAPAARPRRLVRLRDGDTLRLEAGVVRRTILGRDYTMFAFNGQYPGPLIETTRGAEVTVIFSNHLPQPSSVHWHGIRLDNASDGTPGVTQSAVAPGGEFTYRLRFPDAGIYWYHPHVREDVQQELGLYGNILVRSSPGRGYGPANREEVLMLDDLLIGDEGLVPLGAEAPTHALMGRFGNTMLVNGEPKYRLDVKRGEVVRFFLTNAANTRVFNVSLPGARMKLVGSDVGRYGKEMWVESVVIAPAERYVVDVRFDRPGRVAMVNRVRGLDHLYGRFFAEVDTLGVVEVAPRRVARDLAGSFATLGGDTAAASDMRRFLESAGTAPKKTLVLMMEANGLPTVTHRLMQLDSIYFAPVEWSGSMPMMNWASTGRQIRWILRDGETGKENMDIDWRFRRGEPVRIRLVNQRRTFHGMQHPIHLHGQRFLVLSVNGLPNAHPVWKDTVLLPAGSAVDILLDPSNPGRWMLHCHIAEHLSAGMMMPLTVE